MFFFVFTYSLVFTQTDSLVVSGNFSSFSVDHLGTIYTIENQNRLVKHSKKENLPSYQYSQKRYGTISSIDVSNPMKILVAYDDVSTIVVLDNTLKENQSIYLPDIDLYPSHIAFAQNDDLSIWIYDDNNIELIRINNQGQKIASTTAFIQELGFVPQIKEIKTNQDYTILFDVEHGFIICDQFGNYLKQIPIDHISHWQLARQAIFYKKNEELFRYGLNHFNKTKRSNIDTSKKYPLITNQGLYYMNTTGIYFQPSSSKD